MCNISISGLSSNLLIDRIKKLDMYIFCMHINTYENEYHKL